MTDEYLWDGSGTPDPDVVELERALRPLAHGGAPLRPLPARSMPVRQGDPDRPVVQRRAAPNRARPVLIPALTLAATIVLVAYTAYFASTSSGDTEWHVSTLGGMPRINDRAIGGEAAWRAGERLEADDRSVAEIDVGSIGNVEVGPNTRVRLVRARELEHRVALDRGTIRAIIWAPPGLFVVDTPSAVAVDLGCAYSLQVDVNGAGLLRVEHGWVGFRDNGRESFIPQGAVCATRRGRGPGTPYYDDAPLELASALLTLDFGPSSQRSSALAAALAHARPRDALSVWHLLTRTSSEERGRVFDRLAVLVPPPAGVTRKGIVSGNRQMLDAWWNELGLDSASWWRLWETPWAR